MLIKCSRENEPSRLAAAAAAASEIYNIFIIPPANCYCAALRRAHHTQNSSSVCIVGMNYDMLNGSHARSHKLFVCAFLLTFWVWWRIFAKRNSSKYSFLKVEHN